MSSQVSLTDDVVCVVPKRKIRRRRHLKITDEQTRLTSGKTVSQEEFEICIKDDLADIEDVLTLINRVLSIEDEEIVGFVFSIERYGGRNLPWFLSLVDGFDGVENLPEELKGIPRVRDYEIGYYGHELAPGTFQFIRDRCRWAKNYYERELDHTKKKLEETKGEW